MSLIAGVYNRSRDRPLQQSILTSLKRLISRHPSDDIDIFQDPKCVLMKVDIGAYGEKAFHIDSSGSVSMLAGEALLDTSEVLSAPSRSHDLEKLHASWSRGDYSLLRHTRGTFAAIYYQPAPIFAPVWGYHRPAVSFHFGFGGHHHGGHYIHRGRW